MKIFLTIINILTLGLVVFAFAAVGSLSHFYVLFLQSLPFVMFLSLVNGSYGKFFRGGTLFTNGFAVLGGLSATINNVRSDYFGDFFFAFLLMVFVPFVLVSVSNVVYILKKVKKG